MSAGGGSDAAIPRPLRVLLVEDSPGDARLIEIALTDARSIRPVDGPLEIVLADRLGSALTQLADGAIGAVLLDLQLPDSAGLATLRAVQQVAPETPIVVLSGLADEELGARAVREGAQDYLVKGQADGPLIIRSLRFAIERQRAEIEQTRRIHEEAARQEAETALRNARLREEERQRERERELRSLERLTAPSGSVATARSYGVQPLRQGLPETFERLCEAYGALLDRALEQRAYRVENHLSDGLRDFAGELGFLNAGPRDVVELHSTALRARIATAPPKRAQAYVDEARLVVLELMGYLVAYYRNR